MCFRVNGTPTVHLSHDEAKELPLSKQYSQFGKVKILFTLVHFKPKPIDIFDCRKTLIHLAESRFSFSPEIYEGDLVKQKAFIAAMADYLKAQCAAQTEEEKKKTIWDYKYNQRQIREMEAKIILLKAELEEIPIKAEEKRKLREERLKEELNKLGL